MKARFGSIPDNEKWVEKKKWWVGGGRGADHQVVEVFLFLLLVTVMLNSKKVEDLGLVKGACKGIERAGFTVIASEYPSDMGVPFSYYLSDLG